jgi:hypothetical protein
MKLVLRIMVIGFVMVAVSTASLDLLGTSSPWLAILVAAWAAGYSCPDPRAAALCAAIAVFAFESLVLLQGQKDLAQAGLHLAIAALLAAAFALTIRSRTDNSASSQAQGLPLDQATMSEEVGNED